MSSQEFLSGQIGIALLLDNVTMKWAVELAHQYADGNLIDLGGRHTPHITLYHSKFTDIPVEIMHEYLDHLSSNLPLTLDFTSMAAFGGKFLFWDIERTAKLMEAHEYALGLSKYFVPAGEQQADREKISLSNEQDANVRKFGHPLVGALWRPHVTLGYYPNELAIDGRSEKFVGQAVKIACVRVGEAGTIAEIIDSR